jgi:hypothetical protein
MSDKDASLSEPADIEYGGYTRFELELEVTVVSAIAWSIINFLGNSLFNLLPTATISPI